MVRGILYPPNLFNLFLVASYVASLISAIIMFHALSGSTSICARVKGRRQTRSRLFMMEEKIFFCKGKRRGARVRRREDEIIGDSKSDETLAAISEKSTPFHFIALVVGPVLKIRKRRRTSPENSSQFCSRSRKGHAGLLRACRNSPRIAF